MRSGKQRTWRRAIRWFVGGWVAIAVLAWCPTARGTSFTKGLLSDDRETREAALVEVLKHLNIHEVNACILGDLVQALEMNDRDVRIAAMMLLEIVQLRCEQMKDRCCSQLPETFGPVAQRLAERDSEIRETALERLAAYPDEVVASQHNDITRELLVGALGDRTPRVRSLALTVLRKTGEQDLVPTYVEMALTDEDPKVGGTARSNLLHLGQPAIATEVARRSSELHEAMESPQRKDEAYFFANLLLYQPPDIAVPLAPRLLAHSTEAVQRASVNFLEESEDSTLAAHVLTGLGALGPAIDDERDDVRREAFRVIAVAATAHDDPTLEGALADTGRDPAALIAEARMRNTPDLDTFVEVYRAAGPDTFAAMTPEGRGFANGLAHLMVADKKRNLPFRGLGGLSREEHIETAALLLQISPYGTLDSFSRQLLCDHGSARICQDFKDARYAIRSSVQVDLVELAPDLDYLGPR